MLASLALPAEVLLFGGLKNFGGLGVLGSGPEPQTLNPKA